MDLAKTRILPVVAAKLGENPSRLKGQGSSATTNSSTANRLKPSAGRFSRGLVDPKGYPNWSNSKGNQVNIPEPKEYVRQR